MIRDAAEQAGTGNIENMLQVGFFSRRTTEGMGMEGAGQELENLAQMLPGMEPEDLSQKHRADYDALYQAHLLVALLEYSG